MILRPNFATPALAQKSAGCHVQPSFDPPTGTGMDRIMETDEARYATLSSDNEIETSDADESEEDHEAGGGRRLAVRRRGQRAPSPVSSHGYSSTEDETLDDTGSDSEEDIEESRRLKWKRSKSHRPPMMELWAAVRGVSFARRARAPRCFSSSSFSFIPSPCAPLLATPCHGS